jgi:hypothetical protein
MHFEILFEDASGKIALESILEKFLAQAGQITLLEYFPTKALAAFQKA